MSNTTTQKYRGLTIRIEQELNTMSARHAKHLPTAWVQSVAEQDETYKTNARLAYAAFAEGRITRQAMNTTIAWLQLAAVRRHSHSHSNRRAA